MTKKKENKKKKEESIAHSSWYHIAKPIDLTIESFKEEDPSKWFIKPKYRIKAEVIDAPPTIFATFPKEFPSAGLGCAIYNALEREKGSNVVWRIG